MQGATSDSKPPTEGTTKKSDWGLTTSVGWES